MNGQTLHVVTFDPFDDRASMGGFDWFYSEDSAVNRFNEYCKEDTHVVRLINFQTNLFDKDKITQEIDSCVDGLILNSVAEFAPQN